jgi:hypothetical protein
VASRSYGPIEVFSSRRRGVREIVEGFARAVVERNFDYYSVRV